MKVQNLWRQFPIETFILSWGGSGFLPKAPGTWGTLFTIPLIYFFSYINLTQIYFTIFIIALTFFSIFLAQRVQTKLSLKDPQWIVIDEVIGFSICWNFIYVFDLKTVITSFILFRFFDIVKIWPASYFDKLSHGAGTILDDVISGFYAGFVLMIVQKF
jgi:phosphatidylglycerophosphatase A